MQTNQKYVIGVDFGTAGARAIVINSLTGETIASSNMNYPRWEKGYYCNTNINQWRHHPLDYIETMEFVIKDALSQCPAYIPLQIAGIGVDTTGSTPALTDESGTPLAMLPEFADNPDAMFVLWKDHTAVEEAKEINNLCKKWDVDYTKYVGGVYSAEWFWAKAMHLVREDDSVASRAYSIVEVCDWLPAVLTGVKRSEDIIRSRCSYGHKALWHPEWGGLPTEEFFVALEPKLAGFSLRMPTTSFTADNPVGTLSSEWAERLGLPTTVVVAGGAYDCHVGAVGGGVTPGSLVRVVGPSTCDVMVSTYEEIGTKCIKGICGQVDGSVIPGMVGLEAGQSSFGDLFDTFRKVIETPLRQGLTQYFTDKMSRKELSGMINEITNIIMENIDEKAAELSPSVTSILSTDWINGRRSPDANQMLTLSMTGISLDVSAAKMYRALVEGAAYGTKAIVKRFESEGVEIKDVIGIGDIALGSSFVMQVMCDVINKPIKICNTDYACALGSAMFAAVASRIYDNVEDAIAAMNSGFSREYHPNKNNVPIYEKLYNKYQQLGKFSESNETYINEIK
ncbi:MAG: ribulokinase [Prevotella sp.]|nr:ribulokinase [Candidatus Prevotella equi]